VKKPWLTILGIGDAGLNTLTPAQQALLDEAEAVIAPDRVLDVLDLSGKNVEPWSGRLHEIIDDLADRSSERVTVLATGDPMHFGIGATLLRKIKKSEMRIIPSPSAFSLAAARLGWALQDADCISLHGRPVEQLRLFLAPGVRIIALTSDSGTVNAAAGMLCETGYGAAKLTILEHMGGKGERIVRLRADKCGEQEFDDFNTLAIECPAGKGLAALGRAPGLPDEVFSHDGQLTKREVRAVTLGLLRPYPGAVLWDVGAGCGSISIEWMRAARGAKAVAIEPRKDRAGRIGENALSLGAPDLKIVTGKAPVVLKGLEQADAVFCGGGITGKGVFEAAWAGLRRGGIFVANAVTVEGESRLISLQAKHGGDLTRIAVSRAEPVGRLTGWRPAMPVTIWSVIK
jgi:precorrin-6Y C5,15-methyltransferase (decarboxylating)